jgi:hypothetical protein
LIFGIVACERGRRSQRVLFARFGARARLVGARL